MLRKIPARLSDVLYLLLRQPRVFFKAVLAAQGQLKRKEQVKQYGFERGLPVVDLLDMVPNFSVTVEPYSFLHGTSRIVDLALLKVLAQRYEKCRYLEIGTWRGESVANLSGIIEKGVTVDLPLEEIRKRGFFRIYGYFSNGLENISHLNCDTRSTDWSTFGGGEGFDLIFIDGDHSYEGVKSDTGNAFKLLRDGRSVIVWHDYCKTTPEQIRWPIMAGILDGAPEHKWKNIYHVSNTLCAIYINQEYKTSFLNFPEIPNKRFKCTLSAERIEHVAS